MSVLGVYMFDNTWTETYSSSSRLAVEYKIPVSHLLHDYILREAYNNGIKQFDFAGINNNLKASKKNNTDIFKFILTNKLLSSF